MPQIDLDISLIAGWIADPALLFKRSAQELDWDDRWRSRRTASCGLAYNYSGISYADSAMPDFMSAVATRIASEVGHPITNCLANYYATGESRMGWHSDSQERVVPATTTTIVSLGCTRGLSFRPKHAREQRRTIDLESGSLLVMGPSVQHDWEHALLVTEQSEPRISLTFRHLSP